MQIYHNPRCGKSRKALELLNDNGASPEIVLYMNEGVDKKILKSLIKKMKINPVDLVRKNEKLYKEEYKGKELSDDEWISVMSENPRLMERPIIVTEDKVLVGRPPELVLDLF